MGRILALDYGESRIGVAISDETNTIAVARPYIPTDKKHQVLDLVRKNDITKILLGWPINLKGQETKMSEVVQGFARWLEKNTNVPLKLVDERFSTREAAEKLRGQGMKARQHKELVDSLSAQIFLQSYLRNAIQNHSS